MKEPLDKLTLELNKNGISKKVPALHQGWAAPRLFIHFKPIPSLDSQSDEEEILNILSLEQEAWMDRMKFFINDLKWLLHLPHHRFWSQVVYDQEIHDCLNSFLQYAPRYHDSWNPYTTPDMIEYLREAFHLVFLVFVRMATYKEGKDSQITSTVFADIIYDNFLFDISRIMDLCVLYHNRNGPLLKKLVENIFKSQPKFLDDLKKIVPVFFQALDDVAEQFGLTNRGDENTQLVDLQFQLSVLKSLPWHDFEDAVFFLLDISVSFATFLEVYIPSAEIFYNECVPLRIASFYDFVIPIIQEELGRRLLESEYSLEKKALQTKITLIKSNLLNIFRSTSTYTSLYLLKNSELSEKKEVQSNFAETYFEFLMNILSEKNFLCDYEKKFPVEEDIDYFLNQSIPLDITRIEYILDGIHSFTGINEENAIDIKRNIPQGQQNKEEKTSEFRETNNLLYSEGAYASEPVVGVKLDSLISQVLDLLPELGDGFVAACLEYYNYDVERVIHSVLENSLPTNLSGLDKAASREINQTDSMDNKSEEYPKQKQMLSQGDTLKSDILSSRKNVFDNDEFDVFNTDVVDKNKVFKGKRPFGYNGNKYLDDKSQIEKTKELFRKMNVNLNEEIDSMNMYNDEYDDTYDENTVGASEPDRFEEYDIYNRRPFVIPEVLARNQRESESSSEEDDSRLTNGYDENKEEVKESKDCFIANPEELRKKREQRRQQQSSWKTRKVVNSNYDVKGKPKGQGQDENVTNNRHFKEKQKASRSNHNRKNQAGWKRSRGMIPS